MDAENIERQRRVRLRVIRTYTFVLYVISQRSELPSFTIYVTILDEYKHC